MLSLQKLTDTHPAIWCNTCQVNKRQGSMSPRPLAAGIVLTTCIVPANRPRLSTSVPAGAKRKPILVVGFKAEVLFVESWKDEDIFQTVLFLSGDQLPWNLQACFSPQKCQPQDRKIWPSRGPRVFFWKFGVRNFFHWNAISGGEGFSCTTWRGEGFQSTPLGCRRGFRIEAPQRKAVH